MTSEEQAAWRIEKRGRWRIDFTYAHGEMRYTVTGLVLAPDLNSLLEVPIWQTFWSESQAIEFCQNVEEMIGEAG